MIYIYVRIYNTYNYVYNTLNTIEIIVVYLQVHVNLMIMEARNQAELLYALREIMRYMT